MCPKGLAHSSLQSCRIVSVWSETHVHTVSVAGNFDMQRWANNRIAIQKAGGVYIFKQFGMLHRIAESIMILRWFECVEMFGLQVQMLVESAPVTSKICRANHTNRLAGADVDSPDLTVPFVPRRAILVYAGDMLAARPLGGNFAD